MFKQSLVVLFVIVAFASAALALNPFANLFETSNVKRGFGQENGTFNQVVIEKSNSTLQPTTGALTGHFDYNSGKIRQDIQYTIGSQQAFYSTYTFKVSNSISVNYNVENNNCDCYKLDFANQWQPLCIPESGTVSKIKIGNYDGRRVSAKQQDIVSDIWLFSTEEGQLTDKCWMLNTYVSTPNAVQEVFYYDQVQKVDQNVFKVPSQCPTIEKCLAK